MLSPDVPFPIEKVNRELIFLKNFISNPNIEVGDYTYYDGRDRPAEFEKRNVIFGYTARLKIGKFCQIAYGVKFFLSDSNHQMSGFSTYPFFVFGKYGEGCPEWEKYKLELSDKGDTVIGNDVWLGHECAILPGVKVGDGAIIGAKAVVTKDVPPYAIVGGNPAKIIRMRFSDEIVAQLLALRWWDWEVEKISRNVAAITGADIESLSLAK